MTAGAHWRPRSRLGRAAALWAAGLASLAVVSCERRDAHPPSPRHEAPAVTFDHAVHAGRVRMSCLFCHAWADKASVAGIPSIRKCIGCHKFVAKDDRRVQALASYWQKREAPTWPRVVDLPDYVYFSHRMHVRARVDCSACHGQVARMHRIRMARSLDMGFCLDCHRRRHASIDCVTCHK
jgi:hypothetical protein